MREIKKIYLVEQKLMPRRPSSRDHRYLMVTNPAYRNRILDQRALNLLRASTPKQGTFRRKVKKVNPKIVRRDLVFSSAQLDKARARVRQARNRKVR